MRDWHGISSVFLQDKWVWACFPVGEAWMDWGLCQINFKYSGWAWVLLEDHPNHPWVVVDKAGLPSLPPRAGAPVQWEHFRNGKAGPWFNKLPSKLLHKQVWLVCWVWVGFFFIIFTSLDLSGYSHLCAEAAWVPQCWGSYFQENNNIRTSSTKEKVKAHASKNGGGEGKKLGFLGFISCTPSHVLAWEQLKWLKAISSLNWGVKHNILSCFM